MKSLNIRIRKLLLKDSFYITLLILSLIYVFIYIKIPKHSIYNINDTHFGGIVNSYKIDGDKLSILIDAKESLRCNYYFKSEDEKNRYSNILIGSNMTIDAVLKNPINNTIPNTFNYKEYLYYHNIFYTCNIKSFNIDDSNISILYKIKNYVINRIKSFNNASEYLLTFIIGDKSLLSEDAMNSYRENGVTHLFAISGMHIGLFSGALLFIFKKLRISENKSYIMTILFIWFYAFLTGFPSSVLRAGLLFTLLALNKIFYTEVKTLNVLILTGVLLIAINPFIIMDIGFIYSYLTTFGLMYASDTLKKHKVIGTSLVAFLASLPVTINNFYAFNLLSIFFNLFFVPFVSIIVYPLCLITFIFKTLEPILNILLNIMEYISTYLASINMFKIVIHKMSIISIVIYYTLFLLFINRRFKLSVFLLFLVLVIDSNKNMFDKSIYIDFLDVGQGDSAVIRTNRETIMIDTGGELSKKIDEWKKKKEYHIGSNTITYLRSLGINKINTLILSHGDADHAGEASYIIDNIKVDNVVFNNDSFNALEKSLIKKLDELNIKFTKNVNEISIGNSKLYFLNTKIYNNENDSSNVNYLTIDNYKFLFMGDAGVLKEEEILNKYNISNIDVLKVGHHGSKTSSSEDFIDKLDPKYSIISVGKNNKYGHPNKEVLNRLKESKIYRTDKAGSIIFNIKNSKLKINTYPP